VCTGSIFAVALLLQGCAVARWQVPTSPTQGQSEAQQGADAEDCDALAKANSGYDRGVEAKTWLWGIPAAAGVLTTWVVKSAIDTVTIFPIPPVQDAATKTTEAIIATRPKGNPSWGDYFRAYRYCMGERGYTETR
jgi:hypothetical protein